MGYPAQAQTSKMQQENASGNFLKGLTAAAPSPNTNGNGKQQNVINIFTQQVSCSNFYQSCNGDSESKCATRARCENCMTCSKCQRCESCQKAHEQAKCADGQACPAVPLELADQNEEPPIIRQNFQNKGNKI